MIEQQMPPGGIGPGTEVSKWRREQSLRKISQQKRATNQTTEQNHSDIALRRSLGDREIKTRSSSEAGSEKGHSYKRLPGKRQGGGFHHRQIAREADIAIYEQRWTGCVEPSLAYEVIRIRRRKGFWIDDRFIEPAELYPSSEAWGVDGFTITNKDAAFTKLREMA
jgi:hypothetical protein